MSGVFDPSIGFMASVFTPWPTGAHVPRLAIDMIPRPTWGVNVRTYYPDLWQRVRKAALKRNGRRCTSCRNPPKKVFHVHEVFEYDEVAKVQKLVAFRVLCERCHATVHAGRTITRDPRHGLRQVLTALQSANGWTRAETEDHLYRSFEVWNARSEIQDWNVDLRYALTYLDEPEPEQEPDHATPDPQA